MFQSLPIFVLVAAVLVATNAATGWAWLQARDKAATLQERLDNTVDVARECSRGVDALQAQASKRQAAARAAIAAAEKRAGDRNQRADVILAKPPAVVGDDCASAQIQVDEWLSNRQVQP